MHQRQLDNALKIIALYLEKAGGQNRYVPLHIFLQRYYRENKQMGSRDRKINSTLIYNYFRLGNILSSFEPIHRMAIACFLCENKSSEILNLVFSSLDWFSEDNLSLSVPEKVPLLQKKYTSFNLEDIFPFKADLSEGIDKNKFYYSFFLRPRLWLRVKRGYETVVTDELKAKDIPFEISSERPQTISLENSTVLDQLESRRKGLFEVQDLSSQLTGEYFYPSPNEYWWDCCAGSGGKSLMLLDMEPNIKLLASDIRPQIIENLKSRFKIAGIKNYQAGVFDFSVLHSLPGKFDGIIVDAPCSGSGTWSRTPEMLTLFNVKEIQDYQQKQKKIASAVLPALKSGKPLIYITCSVFKAENEDVVNYLNENYQVKVEQMQLIKGYERKADNLYVGRLIR